MSKMGEPAIAGKKRGQVESESRYVQRLSNSSEWLSKMKKRISLCLCVSVVKGVQNELTGCPKWRWTIEN